jgi:non-haem Fe2+, alpha-ketoglutarate-dependent halogenase
VSFERDGIMFPLRALNDGELAAARAQIARIASAQNGMFKRFDRAHLFFRWAWDLVRHPRVVDAVSEVLGDEVMVWGSLILSKPPHDPGFVAWHQDGLYAGFLGDAPAVSAWIAMSDSTIESGCMRVVPGSHKQRLPHEVRNAPDNMLRQGQEIAADVDERDAVDVQLRAGEMSLHHVDIVHGSNPNRASWARTGFIVRYTTPKMLRAVMPVVVARGAQYGHLQTLTEPPPEDFDVSMDAWRRATAANQ